MRVSVAVSSSLQVDNECGQNETAFSSKEYYILIFPVNKLTKCGGVVGLHDVPEGELHPELEGRDPALPRGHLPPQLIPPGPRSGDGHAVQVGEPGQGVERILVEAAIPWDEIFLVFHFHQSRHQT